MHQTNMTYLELTLSMYIMCWKNYKGFSKSNHEVFSLLKKQSINPKPRYVLTNHLCKGS